MYDVLRVSDKQLIVAINNGQVRLVSRTLYFRKTIQFLFLEIYLLSHYPGARG